MTCRASSCTSPSRQPPLILPMSSPPSRTRRRAPGRRYVEPRTATTVARAIFSPRSERVSMASRTSAISLLTVGSSSRDGRQVPGRVRFELLLAGGAAEVIGLTFVFGDEPCGGDVHQHVAHGSDRIDRRGGRGPLVVSTGGAAIGCRR